MEQENNTKMYYNMDIVKFVKSDNKMMPTDENVKGIHSIHVKSDKTGREYHINGIPTDLELNANTEISLCSSTKSYSDFDHLDIIQKDENGNITSQKSYNRTANGTYKENLPKAKKQIKAPIYPRRETTYEL